VVWTGRQREGRGFEYDFFRRDYEVRPPLAVQSSSAMLNLDPEPTFTLKLQRKDTMTPLTAVSVSLSGLGATAPHRTAPIRHAGKHWLLASSARMFPFEFHLVPAIPPSLWSGENVTWATSADGRMCAVVQRGRLRVWRLTSPPSEVITADFPCEKHTYHLPQCGFSKDGRRVFLISARDLYAVDLADGSVRRWSGGGGDLAAFCESPGGERLLATGQDGALYLWHIDGSEAPGRFAGHDGEAVDGAFIDEDTLVSIGDDGSLRVWSTRSRRQLAVFAGETSMAAFALSPAGKEVVTADVGGQAYILQLADSDSEF
jgi:WD40 repeat protein